jgi:ankyrin repeat protein
VIPYLEKPNWESWLLAQDSELTKYLVEIDADIHAHENLAARWAAGNGHLEVVKYLVENKADIHAHDDLAIQWAAERSHLEMVNYLKSLP